MYKSLKFDLRDFEQKRYYTVGVNEVEDLKSLKVPADLYKQELQIVASQYKDIIIPLSGGIDSENLFISCLGAGIKFTPLLMIYENDYNKIDIENALNLCHQHKIEPKILRLDLDDFYNGKTHLFYAEKYGCRSPQLATHLWMMDQINGFFIFPYNPPPVFRDETKRLYISFPPRLYHCYDHYFQKNNRMGISFLSLLTSEIIYSYLTRKIYLDILFNTTFFDYFSHNDYDIKIETYRQSGFSGIRKFSKMTGFEQYRRSLNQKNSAHSSVLSGKDYYDENYRRPMEMIVKDPGYKCVPLVNYERLYQIYLENPKA